MEKLKQSQEIISLGKKLVKEFSEANRCDISIRWMSHYLAELILKAEHEKDPEKKRQIESECCQIIIELWKSRKHFPDRVRPLSNFKEILPVLSALKEEKADILSWGRFIDENHGSGWGKFMSETRKKFDAIVEITLFISLTEDALKREKQWLDHKELLSPEECEIIENLDYLINRKAGHLTIVFEDDDSKDENPETSTSRLDKAFEKLKEHVSELQDNLETLRNEVLKK